MNLYECEQYMNMYTLNTDCTALENNYLDNGIIFIKVKHFPFSESALNKMFRSCYVCQGCRQYPDRACMEILCHVFVSTLSIRFVFDVCEMCLCIMSLCHVFVICLWNLCVKSVSCLWNMSVKLVFLESVSCLWNLSAPCMCVMSLCHICVEYFYVFVLWLCPFFVIYVLCRLYVCHACVMSIVSCYVHALCAKPVCFVLCYVCIVISVGHP